MTPIVDVDLGRGRGGTRKPWVEGEGSLESALHMHDCPSCLFMGRSGEFQGFSVLHGGGCGSASDSNVRCRSLWSLSAPCAMLGRVVPVSKVAAKQAWRSG